MRVFDGTQPTFTQVPPSVPPSTIATRAPRSAALMAAANPAEPPPTTRRSNSSPPLVITDGASDRLDCSFTRARYPAFATSRSLRSAVAYTPALLRDLASHLHTSR